MTIIVVPTEKCNCRCAYCFENPEEINTRNGPAYSYAAIEKSLRLVWNGPYGGSDVTLHGGECLLTSLPELEKLMSLIYNLPWKKDGVFEAGKVKGTVGLVTNATLITDRHIALFKKYNAYVAVSCDGPPELNVLRGPNPKDPAATRRYGELVMENIRKMRAAGVNVSVMCIIHKGNADTKEKRQTLMRWMLDLRKIGITGGRVNPASTSPDMQLSNRDVYQMWINIHALNKKEKLHWNPVIEMERNLTGENKHPAPCVNDRCDLFNTHTLSILPDGQIGNCDRTFDRGLYPRSSDGKASSGRYEALSQTECRGCEWWSLCGGGCPCEGVGDDWRRKTRWCEAMQLTYSYLRTQLRNKGVEVNTQRIPVKKDAEGDSPHGDAPHGDSDHGDSYHGDAPHGDSPHGDSLHGDSPDYQPITPNKGDEE